MKKLLTLLSVGLVALVTAAPVSAQVYSTSGGAYLRTGGDLFAGPGYDYPRVEYVPAGRALRLHGCLGDYAWCDVSSGYARGWVDADDLVVYRGGQPYGLYQSRGWYSYPVINFVFGSYWNDHYRNRSWYHDRNRYQGWNWRGNSHRWGDRDGRPHWRDNDRNNGRSDWRNDRNRDDRGRDDRRDDRNNNNRSDWRVRDNNSNRDSRRNDGVAPVLPPGYIPDQQPSPPQRLDRLSNPEGRVAPPQTRPTPPATQPQASPQPERPAERERLRRNDGEQRQEQ